MNVQVQSTKRRSWRKIFVRLSLIALLVTTVVVVVRHRGGAHKPTVQQHSVGQVPPPQFSIAGGVFTSNITVRLTASSPSGVIRYTVDGSEPTAASRKYSGPITIAGSILLQAKVFEGRSSFSPTASQAYIRLSPELENFSSNLPLVILNSFGRNIPHDQKARVSAHLVDTTTGRSTLAGPAAFHGEGDLNIRGHTSLRYPKRSYHLKTRDDEHNPLKTSLLGFPKDSDWVLYAPYPDKTLMRDVLGYELSNQMGRYASRTRFVEVFLNESGGKLSQRDYLGVFVFEEKIKRGKHRVDIDKLGPDDNAEPNVTGGYLFKKDHLDTIELGPANMGGYPMGGGGRGSMREPYFSGPGGFPGNPEGFCSPAGRTYQSGDGLFQRLAGRFGGKEQAFTTRQGSHFFYVEPKADEITSAQRAWLARYVNKCEEVLYGNNFKDPKTGYAAYLDPDSFIDHHLLVEVTKNIDGFRFSTFYSKDRGGRIKMGPIWDWNLSFGEASGKQGWMPRYWYWPQLDDQQYSWFRRLFEDPDFGQKYVDRWGELRTNQFVVAKLHARIDELAELLKEAQVRNFQRWRIMGRPVYPNNYIGQTFSDEVNYMKQWIQQRIEWIDQQFLAAPSFSAPSGAVARGFSLVLRAPAGKIYYTLDGTDPRAPGGAVSSAAQAFDTSLKLDTNAVVFCRAYQNNRWSYPAVARFTLTH